MTTTLSKTIFICAGLMMSSLAYAVNKYEAYQTMHVSISNHTGTDCTRVNVYQPYGVLVEGSTIPYEIDKRDTATFIMREGMATGPDVTVTYRCGQDTFTVRSWQSQCWLAYGCDTHGEIKAYTTGIIVDEPVDIKNASRYWNEYGQAHFTVRSR